MNEIGMLTDEAIEMLITDEEIKVIEEYIRTHNQVLKKLYSKMVTPKQLLFTYKRETDKNERGISLPFRIGDIVKVKDWGESYNYYTTAFEYFKGENKKPYYSLDTYGGLNMYRERKDAKEFKIFGIIAHPNKNTRNLILLYLKDRLNKDIVINSNGVELVKQYPLRKNENTTIFLKTIKP